MTLGTMTWTCLLLTAGAAPPDVWPMNQKAFQIPIRFDAQRRTEIKELDLYVSRDQGQTWNLEGRATPDKEFFPYAAKEDGPYWFTVAVIDLKNQQTPAIIMTAPVGQRILVDTVPPEIKLNADRQGDQVKVDWTIVEQNPKPETLRLEYADSPQGPWTTVPIKPGPNGHAEFQDPAAVTVRMQMQDTAENQGTAVRQLPAVGGAPPPPPVSPVLPPPPPPNLAGAGVPLPPPPLVPGDPPGAAPDHGVSDWHGRPADAVGASHLPPPPPAALLNDGVPTQPGPSGGTPLAVAAKGTGNQTVAYSSPPGAAAPAPPPGAPYGPEAPAATHGGMPPLQIVPKRQVKLEFDVGKFGPSGLGGVDVYATTDDGATWQQTAIDAGSTQLPSADAHAGVGPVRGSVAVQLSRDAVAYGFCVVVKSRAGLGKPPPRPGDLPQIRVELDTTPPEASLFKPKPDASQPDALILQWEATDRNLTAKPITLEWSAQPAPDAQWNIIGEPEMANTGRFAWQPPPNVPPNVYLRLTVRDTAGNKAVAQTPQPVLIDLSVPEVSNINLGGGPVPVNDR